MMAATIRALRVEFIDKRLAVKELHFYHSNVRYPMMLQRGSDELLSQSGAVSNGASMSPQPHHAADNNNDAKKVSAFNYNMRHGERISSSG